MTAAGDSDRQQERGELRPESARPAAKRSRRRRRLLFVLVALAVGSLLSLLLLELAFRLFWKLPPWFAEFRQAGMYASLDGGTPSLQPGYRGSMALDAGKDVAVRINSLGMRGDELPAPSSERGSRQARVLAIGDSMVFGYGLEAEQALPAVLQERWGPTDTPAVVGNAGVPGYGSRHYAEHLRRLDEPFGADAVLVFSCLGNDPIDDTTPMRVVTSGLMLQGVWARLAQDSFRMRLALRSRAALWLESWLVSNKPELALTASARIDPEEMLRLAGLPPKPQQWGALFLDVADASKTWQPGAVPVVPRLLGYLEDSLAQMREVAGKRALVHVVLPMAWQLDEGIWRDELLRCGLSPSEFRFGELRRRVRAAAAAAGVPSLDAGEALLAEPELRALYLSDRAHLSAEGVRVVANWLAARLAAMPEMWTRKLRAAVQARTK
ncbi:MAG: hypothetical protein AB8H80_04920 [Planctomycetota bacterium]